MKKIVFASLLALAPFLALEYTYRSREKKSIVPKTSERSSWEVISTSENEKTYECSMNFVNENSKYEGTLAEIAIEHKILFKKEYLHDLNLETSIAPNNYAVRKDGYVSAFLVPENSKVEFKLNAKFSGNLESIKSIHAIVLRVKYAIYDRVGYHPNQITDVVFVPMEEEVQQNFKVVQETGAAIYPVKTHLLNDGDDLAEVIKKYAGDFIKAGDVVVLAESPVAIVEGRFKHPSHVKPGFLAKRLCYFVPSVGSLASPYGMQSAMDQIGSLKMAGAMLAGAFMKLLGKNGWFYTLAGMESELIDDLTGTIPPYDKYIVLGPKNPQKTVDELKSKLGVDFAIADANDLKRARILASTLPDSEQIRKWMLNNPAGNSVEQTPIVIIRPEGNS